MRLLLVTVFALSLFGCGPKDPEGTVVKPPETIAPSESGASGIGTGVERIGKIKKN
jgi:hypothetical protein